MVKSTGEVMDCIDPHPYRWHYMNGKQIRPWKYEPLREAWIDEDTLHLKLDSGENLADVKPDSEIDRYDLHPYDPTFDLEHFAIECYRNKIPRGMMRWRDHYMYGAPCLRPFSRNISHEDAKKIDLMPDLAAMYKQMGWKLGFFTLADGCAEYCNVSNEKVKLF